MKVLIMLKGYFPAVEYGGPPVSILNLCSLLNDTYDFYIVACDHEKNSQSRLNNIEEGWNLRSEAKVKYLQDNEINYRSLKRIVDEIEPDMIYVNSLYLAKSTIPLLRISKESGIPCLLAPRGELCANALALKKFKKTIYNLLVLRRLNRTNLFFQATSEEEKKQIKGIFRIEDNRILFLDNVPTLAKNQTRKNIKEPGKLRCVFLSRVHRKKNLLFAIRILRQLSCDITYDIYGPIDDRSYWNLILREISNLPKNVKVNYCGVVNRDAVHQTFTNYDIFFFPTLSENYGQAIVEAMLSNCPIVISDQTPWNDVNESNGGWAIPLEDKSKFINVLQGLVDADATDYHMLLKRNSNYIRSKLDLGAMKRKYLESFGFIMQPDKNIRQ